MGKCKDKSTTYLKRLGYNVVRVPREDIQPLDLIGKQKGFLYLGPLNLLITNPPSELPNVDRDYAAAEVNGQFSSKLDLGVGVDILGGVIGAMGGNLGLNVGYTNAKKLRFKFKDVTLDRAKPLEIGNYLRNSSVDVGNPVLKEYVLGNGELFLVTSTLKSNNISVVYEKKDGTKADLDLPVLKEAVGGNIDVEAQTGLNTEVTYRGTKKLVFGFQCFEVGVADGELRLINAEPGSTFLSVSEEDEGRSEILTSPHVGLLDLE